MAERIPEFLHRRQAFARGHLLNFSGAHDEEYGKNQGVPQAEVSLGTRTVLKLRWLPRRYPSKHSTICVASVLTCLLCSSQSIGRIT